VECSVGGALWKLGGNSKAQEQARQHQPSNVMYASLPALCNAFIMTSFLLPVGYILLGGAIGGNAAA